MSKPPWSYPTYPGGAPISRDTVCLSIYSDMSKRINSIPIIFAICRQTSVLPTPVGPANRNEPTGFISRPNPERVILIAASSDLIAASWPKTTRDRFLPRFFNISRSEEFTVLAGIRAILATIFSISWIPIVFLRCLTGSNLRCAPASSITSIALSGKWRSLMYRDASSVALRRACSVYFTL